MKQFFIIMGIFLGLLILMGYCETKRDPYEEGTHLDYTITCENGFVYKILGDRRGVIQILNSDGTPLRCHQKKY